MADDIFSKAADLTDVARVLDNLGQLREAARFIVSRGASLGAVKAKWAGKAAIEDMAKFSEVAENAKLTALVAAAKAFLG